MATMGTVAALRVIGDTARDIIVRSYTKYYRGLGYNSEVLHHVLPNSRKKSVKIAMPKSRQNLSSLLPIVVYIFFNLFLVVHLRKKDYFRKEKQFSTQNSVFLDQFTGCGGHAICPMANVAMTLICKRKR